MKHSGLGITSFILGLISFAGIVVTVAVVMSIVMPFEDFDPTGKDMFLPMIAGFIMILMGLMALLGLVLGIVGLTVRQDRKKIFAVFGVVLCGLPVVLLFGSLVVGFLSNA